MKGKILKIKTGYNPNSSSIGVDMVVFFTAGAAMTVLFNTMAAVLCAGKAVRQEGPVAEPLREEAAEDLAEDVQCPQ
ncbi:hypothetical protein [Geomesophilobacter sediminis]|uniref:Uncharacterized protein n=1 Tax=Geomesophilobacter sediminis TaxID=2798584 RepID=A0A8J7IPF5_9BACT|nr:hypothetical protein [Geomesophilobacter sediminis]MBJ6724234.1 hypothetical protein [Geomesophilobacter sediminis]